MLETTTQIWLRFRDFGCKMPYEVIERNDPPPIHLPSFVSFRFSTLATCRAKSSNFSGFCVETDKWRHHKAKGEP